MSGAAPSENAHERRSQLTAAVRKSSEHVRGADTKVPTLVLPSGKVDSTAVAFSVFKNLLDTEGPRAALYSVLRLTAGSSWWC